MPDLPELQDEVKHKSGDEVGIVIATYQQNGVDYLDVRTDEKIYYGTCAINWRTITTEEEREW